VSREECFGTKVANDARAFKRQGAIPSGEIWKGKCQAKFPGDGKATAGRMERVAGKQVARLFMQVRQVAGRMARRKDGPKTGNTVIRVDKVGWLGLAG
jgi:hypothetical protein